MSIIAQAYFRDEGAALTQLERLVWPLGPVCPHCGAQDRIGSVVGKGARLGLKFCCRCRKQFRVTLGTMFEGSHVPLHKWFQACFLMAASNDRISAHQLHLRLEVTNKTALCMVRRLRRALRAGADAGHFAACRSDGGERPRPRWRSRGTKPATSGCSTAESAFDGDALPWVKPPGAPRQFLGFIEVARELACDEDQDRFVAALQRLIAHGEPAGRHPRRARERPAPSAPHELPYAAAALWPLPQVSVVPLPEDAALPAARTKLG